MNCGLVQGQHEARLGEGALQHADGVDFGYIARDRDFRDQHVPGAVEHLLFAEGKRFVDVDLQQSFKDLGDTQEVAALHPVGVLFETDFPIAVDKTGAVGQEREDSGDFPVLGDPTEADICRVGERDKDGHAITAQS
jgi:hypothetical protein